MSARASRPSPVQPPGTDAEWAARIRGGDEAAFEALFRTYYDALYRFAWSYVHERETAEDLVHDVLFRVWERRERWTLTGSLKTYLFSATRNGALDYLRHLGTRRRTAGDPAAAGVTLRLAGADEAVEADEVETAIRRALADLPPRCRQTFLLQRQQELTYDEVARVMGVSPDTVKIQMGRALKALRAALGPLLTIGVALRWPV
jgi:RNA polymerase sigma-70 factor, ECF subfamily